MQVLGGVEAGRMKVRWAFGSEAQCFADDVHAENDKLTSILSSSLPLIDH
jgi:hypothetical protein